MFDEVDAHLDAPNAEKLSNIIKERSEGSQFIMDSLKDSVVGSLSDTFCSNNVISSFVLIRRKIKSPLIEKL